MSGASDRGARAGMARVSIVIPTLNESKAIGNVLKKVKACMRTAEILVVDGASEDGTAEIARRHGARVVTEVRRGYGRAYKTGFEHAAGDVIVTMDGDGSYDPSYVPGLLELLGSGGADFVSGNRLDLLQKGSMPFFRSVGNSLISAASNILFSTDIKDNQSGMWAFRKSLLRRLVLKEDGMPFSTEIKLEAYRKCRFVETPVKFHEREGKRSMNAMKQGYVIFKYLFKRRFGRR